MPKPYTIRLFVPEGDPNTFKIIDKMNWTGIGLEISRGSWIKHKNRKEFEKRKEYLEKMIWMQISAVNKTPST